MPSFSVFSFCISILFQFAVTIDYTDHVTSSFTLNQRDRIYSTGESTFLNFQTDGNFVLYRNEPRTSLWDTNTYQIEVDKVKIKRNGNMVLLNASNHIIWQTNTAGRAATEPHHLVVTDDCAYLMDSDYLVFWNVGDGCPKNSFPTFSPPTSYPSSSPTLPTQTPTAVPTNLTTNPTGFPTSSPTEHPTDIPTQNPTILPTESTMNPSLFPTINPADQSISTTLIRNQNGDDSEQNRNVSSIYHISLGDLILAVSAVLIVVSIVAILIIAIKWRKMANELALVRWRKTMKGHASANDPNDVIHINMNAVSSKELEKKDQENVSSNDQNTANMNAQNVVANVSILQLQNMNHDVQLQSSISENGDDDDDMVIDDDDMVIDDINESYRKTAGHY